MKTRIGIVVGSCALACSAFAANRVWTGAGDDDRMSNPANWEGGVAPESGDCLVFAGANRTSPVNDFDPETTSFKGIVFMNGTAACKAPFTLKGNRMVVRQMPARGYDASVNYPFAVWTVAIGDAANAVTDTIEMDLDLPEGGKFGGWACSNHHLVLKGTVTGNGTPFTTMDQYRSSLTVEGELRNWNGVTRPNGTGAVYLKAPVNQFTDTVSTPHSLSEGSLVVYSAGAYGPTGRGLFLGQNMWATQGSFTTYATEDLTISGPLKVRGPHLAAVSGAFRNATRGTTLTLAGDLSVESAVNTASYPNNATGVGALTEFGGEGDGVFSGNVVTANAWIQKTGSGAWTFSGTSASTGTVRVVSGSLAMDGDYAALEYLQVDANATLSGTGRVSNVRFAARSKLAVTGTADGVAAPSVAGTIQVDGTVTVTASGLPALVPGRVYTFLSFGGKTGVGGFVLGDGFPEGAQMTMKSDCLTLMVPSGERTWKGSADNNVWDFESANWQGGATYVDGVSVTFDDTADAGTTNVVVAVPVEPVLATFAGSRDYRLLGAELRGGGGILKSGPSVLTIANTNAYTGATTVNGGALELQGTLAGSPVVVGSDAAFTNAATARISGPVSVSIAGTYCALDGTNDFTEGLYLSNPAGGDKVDTIRYHVRNPAALGAGDVHLLRGALAFTGTSGSAGRGHTFVAGETSGVLVLAATSFTWLGDVENVNVGPLSLRCSSGTFTFGEPGCTTVIRATRNGELNIRDNAAFRFYSRLDLGDGNFAQTDYNRIYLHASGSRWRAMYVKAGTVICEGDDVLAVAPVNLGQTYESHSFNPVLDLNGHDQTVAELIPAPSIATSTETVKSAAPATLTVTNDADTVTVRMQCRIQGAVTLRKRGAGTWSVACRNETTGSVLVEGGTLAVAADDALPTGSDDSTLAISDGAKVVLAEGVNATVSRLVTGEGLARPAGVYGGEGCTVAGAKILPAYFGPGAGAVRVLHGTGGTVLIFR